MPDSIFETTTCRQCGEPIETEFYELRHTSLSPSNERIDAGGGISVPIPAMSGGTLSGVFCSATCLTEYVQTHIAPDATGEQVHR